MITSGGAADGVLDSLRRMVLSPACLIWSALILGIQWFVSTMLQPADAVRFLTELGLSRDGVFSGKIWQLLSYGLIHGNGWHAGLNVLLLVAMGSRVEWILGKRTMFFVMLSAVFLGGISHLLLGSGILVGASGAGFGFLMLVATLSPESRLLPVPVSAKNLGRGILVSSALFCLIQQGSAVPGAGACGDYLTRHGWGGLFRISHACHLGGGLAGWLWGCWLLRPRINLDDLRRARARRERGEP